MATPRTPTGLLAYITCTVTETGRQRVQVCAQLLFLLSPFLCVLCSVSWVVFFLGYFYTCFFKNSLNFSLWKALKHLDTLKSFPFRCIGTYFYTSQLFWFLNLNDLNVSMTMLLATSRKIKSFIVHSDPVLRSPEAPSLSWSLALHIIWSDS